MSKPELKRVMGYSASPPKLNRSIGYSGSIAGPSPKLNGTYKNNRNINNYYNKHATNVNTRPSVQLTQPVYIIKGHGANEFSLNKEFVVPEHCEIIVSEQAGSIKLVEESIKLNIKLCEIPKINLENPSNSSSKIINKLGSVAIFKPGDTCSNFLYGLFDHIIMTELEQKDGTILEIPCLYSGSWGVIPVLDHCKEFSELTDKLEDIKYITRNFKVINDIVEYISERYKYSVYPTKDGIKKYLNNVILPFLKLKNNDVFIDDNDKISKFILILNKSNDHPNAPLFITQKQLCASFGGIFYNLVCRENSSTLPQSNWGNYVNIKNNVNSLKHVKNKNLANTLKKRIGETIIHRTPYIKKFYNERQNGGLNKYKKYKKYKKHRKTHKRKRT